MKSNSLLEKCSSVFEYLICFLSKGGTHRKQIARSLANLHTVLPGRSVINWATRGDQRASSFWPFPVYFRSTMLFHLHIWLYIYSFVGAGWGRPISNRKKASLFSSQAKFKLAQAALPSAWLPVSEEPIGSSKAPISCWDASNVGMPHCCLFYSYASVACDVSITRGKVCTQQDLSN